MIVSARRPKLRVVCTQCGTELDPLALACPSCPNALPRSEYVERRFVPLDREDIFRFSAWLPPDATPPTPIGPTVLENRRLADALGVSELAIALSAYAPELGARNATGTFKDFEALPTLLYLRELGAESIVLASAGNTGRAFAYAGTILEFPTLIVVPESCAASVQVAVRPSEAVRLIALSDCNDYAAAILVASWIAKRFGLRVEGGARNIARRDGMGAAVLEYVRVQRRLPRHYVQAVGSGTGGIAAWEAAVRVIASGAAEGPLPILHLAQNAPFAPLHDAWTRGTEIKPDHDVDDQLRRMAAISAPVLANRTPPYAAVGGVRDALVATSGHTYAVTNAEIAASQELFQRCVGVPVGPESGAALAALRQAVARGWIRRGDAVLLHATGNGDALLRRDATLFQVPIWRRVPARPEEALAALEPDLAP